MDRNYEGIITGVVLGLGLVLFVAMALTGPGSLNYVKFIHHGGAQIELKVDSQIDQNLISGVSRNHLLRKVKIFKINMIEENDVVKILYRARIDDGPAMILIADTVLAKRIIKVRR